MTSMKLPRDFKTKLWRLIAFYSLELLGIFLGFAFVTAAFINIYTGVFFIGIMILGIAYVQSHYYPEKKYRRRK